MNNNIPFGHRTSSKDIDKLQGFDTPEKLEMNSANEHSMGLNIAIKIMNINITTRVIERLKEKTFFIDENANKEYIELLIEEFHRNKISQQAADQIIKHVAKKDFTQIKNTIVDELTNEAVDGIVLGYSMRIEELKKGMGIQ